MPSEQKPIGVGIIGPARFVQYVGERLSLHRDFVPIAACVMGRDPWAASNDDCVPVTGVRSLIHDRRVELVFCSSDISEQVALEAIQVKMHLILESPTGIEAKELRRLDEYAKANGVIATLHQPRHWSEDFLMASHAVQNGLCGRIERVRLAVHERAIPGDSFTRGVLREIGFHYLDQLLMLVDDQRETCYLKRFVASGESKDHGFLAVVDFVSGASAVLELQTRSSLSLRTGWLVEGPKGAYRAGRYYSRTSDGEIVDEPLPNFVNSSDPFLDIVASSARGNTDDSQRLPSLTHTAHVVELIERLEQSESVRDEN